MSDQMTKKELKKQRKLEKKMQREKVAQTQSFTKWIIGGLVLLLLAVGYFKLAKSDASSTMVSDRYEGNPNASVVITEYSDFQCPACAVTNIALDEAFKGYEDRVKLEYKHFPLISIHPNSIPSARAAEAAGQQGKFWEMGLKLFQNQQEWVNENNAYSHFEKYASELGLDTAKFKADYSDKAILKKINAERNEAMSAGYNSTPTLLLNGEKIENPATVEGFRALFDQALGSSPLEASGSAEVAE